MKSLKKANRMAILYLIGLMILMSGCQKDDDIQKTRKVLLTTSTWKIISHTIDPPIKTYDNDGNPTGATSDYYALMADCQKDDTQIFKPDNTIEIDQGPTKCFSESPQKTYGIWSLNSEETILTTTIMDYTQTLTILELTPQLLKVTWTETWAGKASTSIITYSH